MTAKISNYQLAILLYLIRLLSECINFPFEFSNYVMQRFIVIVITKMILFTLYIPLIILATKRPDENFFTILCGKSKVLGWIIFILMGMQFIISSLGGIIKLEFFIANTIMPTAPSWILILLMAVTAIYGTLKGIQVIARTGLVLLVMFIIMLILGVFSLLPETDFLYLYPTVAESPDTIWSDILHELSINNEIFIFAILCRYINKKPAKTIYLYIPALMITVLFMTFLYIVMFGPYINIISFPFYTLSSLIDIIIFNRLDGLDVIIWTLTAVLKIMVFLTCIESMLTSLIKEKPAKRTSVIIGIVMFGAGLFFALNRRLLFLLFDQTEYIIAVVLLVVIMPLIALCVKPKINNKLIEENKNDNHSVKRKEVNENSDKKKKIQAQIDITFNKSD